MTLTCGTTLGPYEIESPLGAGGMGEVYRARDIRLDRTVAVKVLASHLSSSPELKQRMEREARAISSLNHPHICHLYDIGNQDGIDFLVMEFLEGETLADRLRRGNIPLPEMLRVAIEIAEALEVAHRAGIVHRDLKPGNVMLTKSGAKLMDFGLAKPPALAASRGDGAPLLSAARTISGPSPLSPLTTAGAIVGTIQYMSPEQIEGLEVDERCDIFAFGAVLYEMATGRRAFEGKTQITVASAVLEKDPEPVSQHNPIAPASLDYLVATCLAKDREERFQKAHDIRLQLKGISLAKPTASATKPFPRWALAVIAATFLLMVGVAALSFSRRTGAPVFTVRAYIPAPPGTSFRAYGFDAGPVAISPDGRMLAFSAVDEKGVTNLWVRALSAPQARMLPGTEDAAAPFWSPDSEHLAFEADHKLKKISVNGGDPQVLADDTDDNGGAWGPDGTMLFGKSHDKEIYRVSELGGTVAAVTKADKSVWAQRHPFFLPDGKHFLFTSDFIDAPPQVKVGALESVTGGTVVVQGSAAQFSAGYLLFALDGTIQAQAFDPRTLTLSGERQSLGEATQFSVSANGVLAYHESSSRSELKIFDRAGNMIATPGPMARYEDPHFSPDGRNIAVTVTDSKTGAQDVWIYPAGGAQPTRVTFGPNCFWPVWSPDGKQIAYGVTENGRSSIRRRSLDGEGTEHTLYKQEGGYAAPLDWWPDGKYIALDWLSNDQMTILMVPVAGGETFRPPATRDMTQDAFVGRFSPDGRWLAYFSYESSRSESYVGPFPSGAAKYQVSTMGSWLPRFSKTGELFYVTMGNRLMAAKLSGQSNFHIDSVTPLFQLDLPNFTDPSYDVTADGQRFVVITADRTKSSSISLLTNWPAELKH
jgi:serine/threonine protein kinase/Tol biopolymer transport system component